MALKLENIRNLITQSPQTLSDSGEDDDIVEIGDSKSDETISNKRKMLQKNFLSIFDFFFAKENYF